MYSKDNPAAPYALVTGGSQGIGAAIAAELAARGHALILVARSAERLKEQAEAISSRFGAEVRTFAADLSEPDQVEALVRWIHEQGFGINILVNNAGYAMWGWFERMPIDEQMRMLRLNVETLTVLCHRLLPNLLTAPKAWILNVSSTTCYQAIPTFSVYTAAKAYTLTFTRALRLELRQTPVSVSCLVPGATRSGFMDRAGMQAMKAVAAPVEMSAEQVAAIAVKEMFRQKAEIVPGLLNQAQRFLAWLLPKPLMEQIAGNVYMQKVGR